MRYQRGLSLVAVAIVMGIIAFVAALGLVSMRQDKNLFADVWKSMTKSAPVQQVQQATTAPAEPIRKCTIDGKVVYSNTDCPKGSDGKTVQLHDTRGVEAPKAPPPPPPADPAGEMRDKAIERAATGR